MRGSSAQPPRGDWLPTSSRVVLLLSAPLGVAVAFGAPWAVRLPSLYDKLLLDQPGLRNAFLVAGMAGLVNALAVFSLFCAGLMLPGFLIGFVRRPWALALVRKGYLLLAAWFVFYAYVVLEITGLVQAKEIAIHGVKPDAVTVFYWRWDYLWPAALCLSIAAALYILSWRRVALNVYGPASDTGPAPGDRVVENIRVHGRDPVYRKSLLGSFGIHLLVIVLLPWLLQFFGMVEPYRVPQGSGTPEIAAARVKIIKRTKKRKRYVVNPNSAISFHIPDLDESQIARNVEEDTRATYQADPNRVLAMGGGGKMGAGGGKGGGWPEGMANAKVRFIRLEYRGPGWDDGMDAVSRADMNFLAEFKRLTGFPVALQSESHPIALLKKYPKGFAPPFVYMTGSGDISATANDRKILREYLMDGGMLFADCGSPDWDRSFRSFIQQVLPGNPLLVIADDDPIFQMPYAFANGAPPLWHHGGMRALGIKHQERWIVFYHPGDINDAWKTGHSGMNPVLAQGAFQMGVNIVYYSFTHYLEETRKYRK